MTTSWLFSRVLESCERGAAPTLRKWVWKRVYNLLSLGWKDEDWRFMNYGYTPAEPSFALQPEDEPERAFIGLYAQALEGLDTTGKRIVEVGCGRGGGVRYMARYHAPASVTGLDYSPDTVKRARSLNADTANIAFEQGDAEQLPLPDASVDIVVNIESSHCYGNVAAFVREVARVLKPGGIFTFADMRSTGMVGELDLVLQASGLDMIEKRDLTTGVVAALDAADARKKERLGKMRLLRHFVTEFSGARGSMLYNGLSAGDVTYVARRMRKPG